MCGISMNSRRELVLEKFKGEGWQDYELYLYEDAGGWQLQEGFRRFEEAVRQAEYWVKHGVSAKVTDNEGSKIWERTA